MEEKPICGKKRQLVHLNRLQVAGRQKAKSWGARSGLGSVICPQTEGPLRQQGPASAHRALLLASLAGTVEAKEETAHRGLVGQPPDLDAFGTSSPAILLLLNSDMLVCFIKENSRKDMQKPQPYGRPPWTAFIIQSFTKLER